MLSVGLSGAVKGFWEVSDTDRGSEVRGFAAKGNLWQMRKPLAKGFWTD